jgi:hypothetical protein
MLQTVHHVLQVIIVLNLIKNPFYVLLESTQQLVNLSALIAQMVMDALFLTLIVLLNVRVGNIKFKMVTHKSVKTVLLATYVLHHHQPLHNVKLVHIL